MKLKDHQIINELKKELNNLDNKVVSNVNIVRKINIVTIHDDDINYAIVDGSNFVSRENKIISYEILLFKLLFLRNFDTKNLNVFDKVTDFTSLIALLKSYEQKEYLDKFLTDLINIFLNNYCKINEIPKIEIDSCFDDLLELYKYLFKKNKELKNNLNKFLCNFFKESKTLAYNFFHGEYKDLKFPDQDILSTLSVFPFKFKIFIYPKNKEKESLDNINKEIEKLKDKPMFVIIKGV